MSLCLLPHLQEEDGEGTQFLECRSTRSERAYAGQVVSAQRAVQDAF